MGNDASPRPGYDTWISFRGQGQLVDPEFFEDGSLRPDFDTNRYILTGVRGRGSLNCKALWISCLDTWPKILDTYMARHWFRLM
jgi:hypothetical protein